MRRPDVRVCEDARRRRKSDWRPKAGLLGVALICVPGVLRLSAAEAPLIAVDVGHSAARPGAVSARGRPEFAFNQELAVVVDRTLRERGFRTQTIGVGGDVNDLAARTALAADAGSDFFLSIHHDSVQPQYLEAWMVNGREQRYSERFSGFSLFVSRKNPRPAESLLCAQEIGAALRAAGQSPSLHHAEPIRGENRPLADASNGVYFFDDLIVLKTARTPAVLVEAGIIVNPNDELRLRQPVLQRRIAGALADGLQRCLDGPARQGDTSKQR
jgi:N-acetylmuramoyl-L-alanine amidase